MTARLRSIVPLALVVLVLLAGCASPAPQTRTAPQAPAEIITGSGTDSERSQINSQDNQIYRAEHGSGSDYPMTLSGTNQDIP